eukprot:3841316-Prymnesium_polylepis.2
MVSVYGCAHVYVASACVEPCSYCVCPASSSLLTFTTPRDDDRVYTKARYSYWFYQFNRLIAINRSGFSTKTWSSRRYVQICTFVAKSYRSQVRLGAAAVGRAVRPDRAS